MEDIICANCGLVNDYSTTPSGPHIKATCNGCGKYIKFISQGDSPSKKHKLYFGKYSGREISSMNAEDEIKYLQWLIKQDFLKSNVKTPVLTQLKRLNRL